MTTEEVKKAIESKINEIDNLRREITTIVFEHPQIIKRIGDMGKDIGYTGDYVAKTNNKDLGFAVNKDGWISSFTTYMMGVEEMPCIKEFVSKQLKKIAE